VFDLGAGTVNNINLTDARIEDVGNGWYRCSGYSSTATTAARIYFQDGQLFTGNDSDGIYLWGAQLEAGSFATSYIPTNGTEVTREPDIASMPVSEFNYNQSAGTVVVEYSSVSPNTIQNKRVFSLVGDPIGDEQIALYSSTGNFHRGYAVDGGALLAIPIAATGWTENQFYTTALTVDATDMTISTDGAAVVTDPTGSMPTVTGLHFGSESISGRYLNGHIRSLKYWPQRLSDATLQAVTQG
jgi:hypothetical protein